MILGLYNGVMRLGGPAIDLMLKRRLAKGKEDAARIDERRGITLTARPPGQLIWMHAASVGESVAALALVDRLLEDDAGRHVLVTTGTVTSARMMAKRLPERALHQYIPVDRPGWVDRFLDHWRPDLGMLVESEFWPNLILRSRSRGMQLVLINGRMSERSHGRWQMAGASARKVFESFDLAFASNEDQVARMGSLGVSPVECVGNIKLAAPALSIDDAALSELRDIAMDRPVWIAASTHAGEEEAVLAAHHQVRQRHPDALCIIIPRHPDRGPGIAKLTAAAGHTVARRAAGEMPDAGHAVYVADTMGEMGVFFALASVVFVAGSLVPVGGHNPVEPAHFDTAVLIGPLMSKNIEIAQEFLARGGALEVTADTLGAQVTELLANPERRTELADAARTIAQDHMGVLDLVMDRLAPLLAAAKR